MSNPFRVNNLVKENQATRSYSDRQEKAVAKAVGGKQTKNSGATLFGGKADVKKNNISFECKTKTTNSDSITIKREWFDKLIKERLQDGNDYSVLVFNFGPDKPYNENHYVIDEYLFKLLLEYLENEEKS